MSSIQLIVYLYSIKRRIFKEVAKEWKNMKIPSELAKKKDSKNNKRGDPWSQACMKIEMRLRCYLDTKVYL